MKKAPFLAVLVLLLGGCTADGDVNDGYEGNNSAAAEEQIGNRENDRLYVNGDGDGYVKFKKQDCKYYKMVKFSLKDLKKCVRCSIISSKDIGTVPLVG